MLATSYGVLVIAFGRGRVHWEETDDVDTLENVELFDVAIGCEDLVQQLFCHSGWQLANEQLVLG
jgi:hypothetical protein